MSINKINHCDSLLECALKIAEFARSVKEDVISGANTPDEETFRLMRKEAINLQRMLIHTEEALKQ
jgi:hypothetical protein